MATPSIIGQMVAHYRITTALGSGGMGQVYLAYDTRLGRNVALKFLPDSALGDRAAIERFIREARAASALNHPNIITIFDIGETAGMGRFLVLEFIEGRTLRAVMAEGVSAETLVEISSQVLKALVSAHDSGIVHRDIKPENIMVRNDGYVKVLDFGLARVAPSITAERADETEFDTAPGTLLGTYRYMAPEQLRAEVATSASDVFSLGIVLYELAARRHPFHADSRVGVLDGILSRAPIQVCWLNPEIPPALDSVIMSMLEKDARLRPTAAQLQSMLAGLTTGKISAKSGAPVPGLKRKIVGRHKELNELRAEFKSAESGRGSLVCVTGEAGLGKTSLVEEYLAELARDTAKVSIGCGRCSERLAGTGAYLPFLEAFENLLHGEMSQLIIGVMKLTAPTWYLQVAPLTDDPTSSVRLLSEASAASQDRLKRELLTFLKKVSQIQPVVLFLDDLHWADLSTVDLLAYIGGKCDSMRVLIVVSYRPSDLLLSKHAFLPVKLDLQSRGLCREIALTMLNDTDVDRYLAIEFREHSFPIEFVQLIHARTEGNPLFMVDLVRYLRDRNAVGQEQGQWKLLHPLTDIEIHIPESVRSMIQRKIDQFSETARKLLTACAVQGYEFDSSVVAVAVGLDPADVEEQLEFLDRAHSFVHQSGEREFADGSLTLQYRFVHILYQNALYNALGPTRRATLSAAIAKELIARHGKRTNDIAAELAFLFEAARDFPQATHYFLAAAQNAGRIFANKEAVALSQRGLDLIKKMSEGPETDERELMLLVVLGVPLMAIKGYGAPEVQSTYKRARELCLKLGEETHLGAVLWGLFVFHLVRAELTAAREITHQLLSRAEEAQDSALLMTALWAVGVTLVNLGELRAGKEALEKGIALYDPKRHRTYSVLLGLDPGVRLRCEWVRCLWLLGRPDEALQRSHETIRMAQQLNHPPNLAFPLIYCAMVHQFRREPGAAQERAETAIALSREHGMPQFLAWGITWQAWAMAMEGHAKGIDLIKQSLEAHEAMKFKVNRPHFLAMLAEGLAKAGRLDDAVAAVREAFELVHTAGADYYEAELHRLNGELILMRPDPTEAAIPEAEECFRQAVTIAHQQGAKCLELRAATALGRLWQRTGKSQEARQLLGPVYEWFTEGFDTLDLQEAKAVLRELSGSH